MLKRLNKDMNAWYKSQGPVSRFFVNIGLMALVVTVLLGGFGLYCVMIGYTIYLVSAVSPWFLFLLIAEISITIGIKFAIDMAKEENYGR